MGLAELIRLNPPWGNDALWAGQATQDTPSGSACRIRSVNIFGTGCASGSRPCG